MLACAGLVSVCPVFCKRGDNVCGDKSLFLFFRGWLRLRASVVGFFSVPQESAETKVPVSSSPPLFCVFVFVLKGGHYLGLFFHCAAPMCHVLCFLTSVHGGFSQVREEKQARYRGFFFLRRVGEAVSCVVKTRVADLGMHLCTHCETFVVPGLFIPCQEPLASHRNTKRKKKNIEIFVPQSARSSLLSAVPKDSFCMLLSSNFFFFFY